MLEKTMVNSINENRSVEFINIVHGKNSLQSNLLILFAGIYFLSVYIGHFLPQGEIFLGVDYSEIIYFTALIAILNNFKELTYFINIKNINVFIIWCIFIFLLVNPVITSSELLGKYYWNYFVNFSMPIILLFMGFSIINKNLFERFLKIYWILLLFIIATIIYDNIYYKDVIISMVYTNRYAGRQILEVSDRFCLFSLMLILFIKENKGKYLMYLTISIAFIIILRSFGTIFSFLIILLSVFFYPKLKKNTVSKFSSLLIIIILIMFSLYYEKEIYNWIINLNLFNSNNKIVDRIYQILLFKDDSFISRLYLLKYSIGLIKKFFFFGKYLYQINYSYSHSYGAYVHNIISYWLEFGFIPFILLVILIVRVFCRLIHSIKKNNNIIAKVIIMALFFEIILVVFFRSYRTKDIWFVLGMGLGVNNLYLRNRNAFTRIKIKNSEENKCEY